MIVRDSIVQLTNSLSSKLKSLRQVYFVKIVGTKGSTTLGTLAQARVIAIANTLRAEHMEALCQNSVLLACATTRAVELSLQTDEGNGIYRRQDDMEFQIRKHCKAMR